MTLTNAPDGSQLAFTGNTGFYLPTGNGDQGLILLAGTSSTGASNWTILQASDVNGQLVGNPLSTVDGAIGSPLVNSSGQFVFGVGNGSATYTPTDQSWSVTGQTIAGSANGSGVSLAINSDNGVMLQQDAIGDVQLGTATPVYGPNGLTEWVPSGSGSGLFIGSGNGVLTQNGGVIGEAQALPGGYSLFSFTNGQSQQLATPDGQGNVSLSALTSLPNATIGGETVTLIGLGGSSPFALISNDNSTSTASAVSSNIMVGSDGSMTLSVNIDGSPTWITVHPTESPDESPSLIETQGTDVGGETAVNTTFVDGSGDQTTSSTTDVDGLFVGSVLAGSIGQFYALGGGTNPLVGITGEALSAALISEDSWENLSAKDQAAIIQSGGSPPDFTTDFSTGFAGAGAAYLADGLVKEQNLPNWATQLIEGPINGSIEKFTTAVVDELLEGDSLDGALDYGLQAAESGAIAGLSSAGQSIIAQELISAIFGNQANNKDIQVGAAIGSLLGALDPGLAITGELAGAIIGSLFGPQAPSVGPDGNAWMGWSGGTNFALITTGAYKPNADNTDGASEQAAILGDVENMANQASVQMNGILNALITNGNSSGAPL